MLAPCSCVFDSAPDRGEAAIIPSKADHVPTDLSLVFAHATNLFPVSVCTTFVQQPLSSFLSVSGLGAAVEGDDPGAAALKMQTIMALTAQLLGKKTALVVQASGLRAYPLFQPAAASLLCLLWIP